MAPRLSDPPVSSRPGRPPPGRRRATVTAPLALVLPGQGRFAAGADGAAAACGGRRFTGPASSTLELPAHVRAAGRRHRRRSISQPAGNLERGDAARPRAAPLGASHAFTALLPPPGLARARTALGPLRAFGLAWVGGLLRARQVNEVVCVDVHSEEAGAGARAAGRVAVARRPVGRGRCRAQASGCQLPVAPDEGARSASGAPRSPKRSAPMSRSSGCASAGRLTGLELHLGDRRLAWAERASSFVYILDTGGHTRLVQLSAAPLSAWRTSAS